MTKKEMAEILSWALDGLDHLSGDHEVAAIRGISKVIDQLETDGKDDPKPEVDYLEFYDMD
jgi:hypothetical protein